jgi:DNA-binding IclR family transcriptional regulator
MAVRQIENTLALLEYFAEHQSPATLADVVAHFGWPRSSAFNILSTLAEAGYLYEPHARGGFYPSSRWSHVVTAITAAEPLPDALRRIIRKLADETQETVWISAPGGMFAVFLDVIESQSSVRYAAEPGKRVPIHITATGQALLSKFSEQDRQIVLRKASFGSFGPNAPTNVEDVIQQIEVGQARGWFDSASHFSPDLGGVSVPVELSNRIFAITVGGPLFRVQDKTETHASAIRLAIADEIGTVD